MLTSVQLEPDMSMDFAVSHTTPQSRTFSLKVKVTVVVSPMVRVESAKTADSRRGFTLSILREPEAPCCPGPGLPSASCMLASHIPNFAYPGTPAFGVNVTVHWVLLLPATAVRLLSVKRPSLPSMAYRLARLKDSGRIGLLNVMVAVVLTSRSFMTRLGIVAFIAYVMVTLRVAMGCSLGGMIGVRIRCWRHLCARAWHRSLRVLRRLLLVPWRPA